MNESDNYHLLAMVNTEVNDPRLWDLISNGVELRLENISQQQYIGLFQTKVQFQLMEINLNLSGVDDVEVSYTYINESSHTEKVNI